MAGIMQFNPPLRTEVSSVVSEAQRIARASGNIHAALPPQVVNAILYHDGLYGENADQVMGNETPLLIIMHFADMMSSRLARPPKAVEPE